MAFNTLFILVAAALFLVVGILALVGGVTTATLVALTAFGLASFAAGHLPV